MSFPEKEKRLIIGIAILGIQIAFGLLAVGLALGVGWNLGIPGDKLNLEDIPTKFGFLVLMALFVERVTAIYLSIFTDQKKRRQARARVISARVDLEDAVSFVKERVIPPQHDYLEAAQCCYYDSLSERAEIRNEEDFKATIPSVILGMIIAFAGVHALEFFIDETFYQDANEILLFVDVALTGLLLGGGAQGIREIWRIIEEYRDS